MKNFSIKCVPNTRAKEICLIIGDVLGLVNVQDFRLRILSASDNETRSIDNDEVIYDIVKDRA